MNEIKRALDIYIGNFESYKRGEISGKDFRKCQEAYLAVVDMYKWGCE